MLYLLGHRLPASPPCSPTEHRKLVSSPIDLGSTPAFTGILSSPSVSALAEQLVNERLRERLRTPSVRIKGQGLTKMLHCNDVIAFARPMAT